MWVHDQCDQGRFGVFPWDQQLINQTQELDSPPKLWFCWGDIFTTALLLLFSFSHSFSPPLCPMRQWNIGEVKGHRSGWYSRHSLIDGLHSVSHGELIHYLLRHVVKIDLPRLVPFHLRYLHHAAALHLRQVVEQVLRDNTEHVTVMEHSTEWPLSQLLNCLLQSCNYWLLQNPITVQ